MKVLKIIFTFLKNILKYALYLILLIFLFIGIWILYVNHLKNGFSNGYTEHGSVPNHNNEQRSDYQSILDAISTDYDSAGIQATILFKNGEKWTGSSGYANHSKKIPVTNQSLFNIGSVTKLYTATLIMSLVEQQKLSLDDRLSKVLSVDNSSWNDLTIKQLLSHRSGIPDYMEAGVLKLFAFPNRSWKEDELIEMIYEHQMLEPNNFNYSNTNYLLLSRIIDEISELNFRETLLEQTITPLDLNSTFYDDPNTAKLPIVHSYETAIPGFDRLNVTGFRTSFLTSGKSAGAILSNSEDVARFTQALFNNEIVSEPYLNKMTMFNPINDSQTPLNTGYGLGVSRWNIADQELWGHKGFIPGFNTITMYSPKHHYVITVLANQSNIITNNILKELQNALLNKIDNR